MRDFRIFQKLDAINAGDLTKKDICESVDSEPSKMAEQASGVVNMLARVSDKGVMSAAEYADVSEAKKDGYWPDANDPTVSTVLLEDVPVDVARQLYSVGSADDHFANGKDAWHCASEYCVEEGKPRIDPARSRRQVGRRLPVQKQEMDPRSEEELTIVNKNAHKPWDDATKKRFIKRGYVSHTADEATTEDKPEKEELSVFTPPKGTKTKKGRTYPRSTLGKWAKHEKAKETKVGAMEAKLIKLRESGRKLYEDGAPVRTIPEVPVPTKIPRPRPNRPTSPLKPGPGQKPRPKAGMSHDMELFIAKRRGGVDEMAFEPGKTDALIDPSWKDWIESGGDELKELLPELGEEGQSYLEMITSQEYQEMIGRIEKATGTDIDQMSMPGFVSILMQSLQQAQALEAGHAEELEQLAIKTVLELPEFEILAEVYNAGELKLDVKLSTEFPALQLGEQGEGELEPEEQMNVDLFGVLDGADEEKLRRRLANLIIQGNASIKMQLYKMVVPELEAIGENLPEIYGLLAIAAELGYWIMPKDAAEKGGMPIPGGSEEVAPEEEGDVYVIHAHALNFPYLMHELVKGIYEWIALDTSGAEAGKQDSIGKESEDMVAGPGVVKSITSYVSTEDQKYIPALKKAILQLSRDEIRDILSHTPEGEQLIKDLLVRVKQEWAEYEEETRRADAEEFEEE